MVFFSDLHIQQYTKNKFQYTDTYTYKKEIMEPLDGELVPDDHFELTYYGSHQLQQRCAISPRHSLCHHCDSFYEIYSYDVHDASVGGFCHL